MAAPKKIGRPTKLTPAVAKRIIRAISLGHSYVAAAKAGGINIETLDNWRKRGAEERNAGLSTPFTRFLGKIEGAAEQKAVEYLEAIERSMNEPIVVERTHIKKDAQGNQIVEKWTETKPNDIKGALWWLERRFPDQFGRREKVEHAGKVQTEEVGPRKVQIELVRTDADAAAEPTRVEAGPEGTEAGTESDPGTGQP